MLPNEPSRDGFNLLDPANSASLSASQRELIVQQVLARGPDLILHARRAQYAQRTAVVGCIAAAAALVVMNVPRDSEPIGAPLAVVPARTCDTDTTNTQPTFSYDDNGRGSLALGERANVVTEPGAAVAVVSSTSCTTLLALTSGEATVQARDLRGGTLHIRTPYGDVQARSTLFRVSVLASSVVIGVADGEVSVMRAERPLTAVAKNQSVKLDSEGGVSRSSLSAEEAGTLRSNLTSFQKGSDAIAATETATTDESVRARQPGTQGKRQKRMNLSRAGQTESPVLSPANKLAQADALWRAGEVHEARALFREAARDPGPTGEAAWVRLSRLELSRRDAAAALSALQQRAQRKGGGVLQAEAMWLEVQALQMSGRTEAAEARANDLIRSFASSPQAVAARRYLQEK